MDPASGRSAGELFGEWLDRSGGADLLGELFAQPARKIADTIVRPGAAKHDKAQEYNYDAARAVVAVRSASSLLASWP